MLLSGAAASLYPPYRMFQCQDNSCSSKSELIDLNGDGLPDFVEAWATSEGVEHLKTWINIGNDFIDAQSLTDEHKISARKSSPVPYPDVMDHIEAAAFLKLSSVDDLTDFVAERGLLGLSRNAKGWTVTRKSLETALEAGSSAWKRLHVRHVDKPMASTPVLVPVKANGEDIISIARQGLGLTAHDNSMKLHLMSTFAPVHSAEYLKENDTLLLSDREISPGEMYCLPNDLPVHVINDKFSYQYSDYIDVNGDGLIDYMTSYKNVGNGKTYLYTYLNTGWSFCCLNGCSPDECNPACY